MSSSKITSTSDRGELKINPAWAQLPLFDRKSWKTVRFGDVVRMQKEQVDPEADGIERYVAGEHMETENVHIRKWGTVGNGYLGPAFIRGFRKGQVLYGSRRTYLKKVAVAEWDGVTANTTFVLESAKERLLPELLPWLMLSERFTKHSVQESKGSTNPYINFPDIAKFEFALPPLDQQRRIAEILWAADDSIERYLSVLADIHKQRLALVKAEVEEPKPGWTTSNFESLVTETLLGTSARGTDGLAGVQLLKMGNMTWGKLQMSKVELIAEDKIEDFDRYLLREGDFLFNTRNTPELVGKTAVWSETGSKCVFDNNILRCRFRPDVNPHFVCYQLSTGRGKRSLNRLASGSTSVAAIYWTSLRKLKLTLPPIQEQNLTCQKIHEIELLECGVKNCVEEIRKTRNAIASVVF